MLYANTILLGASLLFYVFRDQGTGKEKQFS